MIAEARENEIDVESVVQTALGEHARCAPHLFARSSFSGYGGSAELAIHEGTVEVTAGSSGGDGVSDFFLAIVDHVGCRPLITVGTGWVEGELMSNARVGIAPARDVVRMLQGNTVLRAYAHTAPEAALFQLLLRERRRDPRHSHVTSTFELRGPLFGPSPTFRGTPQPSEVGYLVPTSGLRGEQLRSLQARLDSEGEEPDDEEEGEGDDESEAPEPRPALPAFVRVMGVRGVEDYASGPFLVRSFGMFGRHQGVLVALMDTTTNTYRWVLVMPSAVQGSSVQWRGAHRGFLVGEYQSLVPNASYPGAGMVLLRLADGAVFELDVPGIFEQGESVLAMELEDRATEEDEACRETTTRAFAASTGYPISELEDAPWWCRENEVLVRLRTEIENACTAMGGLHARVDGGTLRLPTLDGDRLISLDEVIDAAP